ncbi:RimK family alpha-L-glutamate ligase [Streptomyces sp. NBC_00249]|uniref:RimK family alpha-L-glutamate ligase n=1 Tax=Streptomyces sp. NBC_00249 TaxID=2975690 RepID=UPI002B1DD434|nr:RimK family alpha-L-glutamate ligase [Streptomyces sp. NBC_00249]
MTAGGVEASFAMVASRVRTDEKRLLDAFDRHGLRCEVIDSRRFWQALEADPVPHFGTGRPRRVVLNREIGHARAVYAARALESVNAVVVNSATATEVCGDKYRTSLALRAAGLPTPRTALALTPEAAMDALEAIGYPAVVKPLTGSWGRLVSRLPDREAAETVMEYIAALPGASSHLVYVQELVAKPDRDIRVVVVGGRVVGAVYRRGGGWRTNVARGAETVRCTVTAEIEKLAVEAARCVEADISGVDLIEDADGGLSVLEVNHGVEFTGFQRALGDSVPVADAVLDHLKERAASC